MTQQKEDNNLGTYGYPKAVHELAEIYINRDILKCDSLLIGELLSHSHQIAQEEISKEFTHDNIDNFYDDPPEAVEEFLIYNGKDDNWQNLPFDERESIAQDLGFEPQPKEIYEWWAVTKWLADNLAQFCEPVLENAYGYWWGRTCTGQAIILDGTIQKIAEQYLE